MESVFSEILSHNLDPRSKITEFLPSIKDLCWAKKSFKDEAYSRDVICKAGDLNEVVLACWKKGQVTTFHSHPNQSCWIYVLKGQFQEVRIPSVIGFSIKDGLLEWNDLEAEYKKHNAWSEIQDSKVTSVISEGTWNYIDDTLGIHKMSALSDEVISLHIYRQMEQ